MMDPSQLLKDAHGLGRFALSRKLASQAVLTQQFNEYEQYLAGGGREQFSTMLVHRQILTPDLIQQYQAMTQSALRNMAPPFQSAVSSPHSQNPIAPDYNPISAPLTQSSRAPVSQSSGGPLIHTPPPSMNQSSRSASNNAELHQSQSKQRPELQIPGYTIQETLGEGGMGVVYRATNSKNDHVAIKVIKNQFASQRAQKRFAREGDVMNKLEHPNIVKIYDTGTTEAGDYIAMELLYGDPLDELVKESRPSPTRALEIIVELCKGVAAAHDQDIIHRDLKPSNIMIVDGNKVKVMDFGLAKDLNRETMLTQESAILGTPHYLSPEQAMGEHKLLGPHSDVFSIGVIMYELLTGERPFISDTAAGLYIRIAEFQPTSPNEKDPTVPKMLSDIVMKALHKDLNDRYPDARKLSADIQRVLAGETFNVEKVRGSWLRSIRKHPLRSLGVGLLVLALATSPITFNQWKEFHRSIKRAETSKSLEKSLLETVPLLKEGIKRKDKSLIEALKQLQKTEKQIELFSNRDDDAAKSLVALLSKPKYVKIRAEAFISYSQLLFDANNFSESLAYSRKAVQSLEPDNPYYPGALLLLTRSQFAMGQSKAALSQLEGYLSTAGAANKDLLLFKSRIHEDLRDLDQAIASLDKALELSLDSLARADKARLLALKGEAKQSERIFKALLKKYRNNRPLLLIRARSLEDQRRFDESLALLTRIQRIAPKDLSLRRARVRLFIELGRLSDAYNELTVALETIETDGVLLRIERAQLALDQGEVQRARDDLNRVLSKTRTDADVIAVSLAFTRLFVMEGQLEKARKKIGEAVQLYPRQARVLKLAIALTSDPDPKWIERLIEIAPRDPWALQQEVLFYLKKKQLKLAAQRARRLTLRFPKNPRGYLVLARAIEKSEPERSAEMFRKYSAIRSDTVRRGIGLAGRVHRLLALKTTNTIALAKPILRWLAIIEGSDCETWRLMSSEPKLPISKVRSHLNKALNLNPHCPLSHYQRTEIRGKGQYPDEAIAKSAEVARPLIQHNPVQERRLLKRWIGALVALKKVPEALALIDRYETLHVRVLYSQRIELAKIVKDTKLIKSLEKNQKAVNKRYSALKNSLDKRVKAIRGASHMDTKTMDHIRKGREELAEVLTLVPNSADIRYFRSIIALRASNAFGYILMKSRSISHGSSYLPGYVHTSFGARAWLSETGIEEFIEAPAKEFGISESEKYFCRALFHVVDSLVDIGENLEFKKARARKALQEAERCLYFDPEAKTAYVLRAYCHAFLGHSYQAANDFSHFTSKSERLNVHYFKALLALNAKQNKEGLKQIKLMVKNGFLKSQLPVNPVTKPLRQSEEYRQFLQSK